MNSDYESKDFNYRLRSMARYCEPPFEIDSDRLSEWAALPIQPGVIPGTNDRATLDQTGLLTIQTFQRHQDLGLFPDHLISLLMAPWFRTLRPDQYRQMMNQLAFGITCLSDRRAMKSHGFASSPRERDASDQIEQIITELRPTRDEWNAIYDMAFADKNGQ